LSCTLANVNIHKREVGRGKLNIVVTNAIFDESKNFFYQQNIKLVFLSKLKISNSLVPQLPGYVQVLQISLGIKTLSISNKKHAGYFAKLKYNV